MSVTNRVDRLDMSLFDEIEGGCASSEDRRSLLAVHAALASRGDFSYLEVGSYHGASLQSFIADPRCRRIVSIDRRDAASPDTRAEGAARYPDNTTAWMLERLARVPGADLTKLMTVDGTTTDVDPAELRVDLCLIDAQHTDAAALADARFCRQAIGDRGMIVFHDRLLVDRGIQRFLGEVNRCRAYPLAHDLLVVEVDVPSLMDDPRVRAQLPGDVWLAVDRLRLTRWALGLAPIIRAVREGAASALTRGSAPVALTLGAPRRNTRQTPEPLSPPETAFEVSTFVNNETLYAQMRRSYIEAGFDPDAFVRLTDADDDPYTAITRIGRESIARYPILCHQDVLVDQGAGASQLLSVLQQLDAMDPGWVVAGNAGVMRSGRVLRRLLDGAGGSTGERLPLPVTNLDENFLVFNRRNRPHCSPELSEFHLYGADVCLHGLASGGSAYVIDFPITHLGQTRDEHKNAYWRVYDRAKRRFITVWNDRFLFRYVLTPSDTFFLSRSKLLRQTFGSPRAVAAVAERNQTLYGTPLRRTDCCAARQTGRWQSIRHGR